MSLRRYDQVWLTVVLAVASSTGWCPQVHGQQGLEQLSTPAKSEPLSSPSTAIPKKEGKPLPPKNSHPVRPLPRPKPGEKKPVHDGALQSKPKGPTASLNVVLPNPFDGVGEHLDYSSPVDPADTVGAVGPTQYVQWVNQAIGVFDKKTGDLVGHVADGKTLWSKLGGPCATYNDGDPIVLYDRSVERWILSQFAVSGGESNNPDKPYVQCVAVSTTPDATGAYFLYAFNFENLNDYGKMAVWPDAYYAAFNMFKHTLPDPNDTKYTFLGARACALEKAKMVSGDPAHMKCFDLPSAEGLLPSDNDGSSPPPDGSPNYFLGLDLDNARLNMWTFHVNWNDVSSSALVGPTPIQVASFNLAPDNIPQPKTSEPLQSMGDRLMFRLAYRRFSDHESLVATHAVGIGTSAGVRWYEIRNLQAAPQVFQQGTVAPDGTSRWLSSAAMDKAGNILIGYSASSLKILPSIMISGRETADPLGTVRAEQNVLASQRSQTNSNRWGDYSSVTVDPDDDCTFYFGTEYLEPQKANWSTKVLKIRFTTCN